jgi:hypothetical protein
MEYEITLKVVDIQDLTIHIESRNPLLMMITVGLAAYYPPIYPIDGLDIYLVVNRQLSTGKYHSPTTRRVCQTLC